MNDSVMIDHSKFVEICHVTNTKNFGGFRVEADGLYVVMPNADVTLNPKERSVLSWHPTGDHATPALRLPCDMRQLRKFVSEVGLVGCIDEDELHVLQASASDAAADTPAESLLDNTPGKLPNTAIGKLAIEAAWQIERETKRAATATQVLTRLQAMADDGKEPATLIKSDKPNRAVIWNTDKRMQKSFSIEACGKALKTWQKSRA